MPPKNLNNDEPLSDIQKLIRLKRFEVPPEDAVDGFLEEFQRRQRSQALTGSSTKLLFERVTTFMSSFGNARWVFAGGAAYACVMLFALVRPTVSPMGAQPNNGGSVKPVGSTGGQINQTPTYDLKRVDPVRPVPEVPEVRVF